jgi:hypothetical protein
MDDLLERALELIQRAMPREGDVYEVSAEDVLALASAVEREVELRAKRKRRQRARRRS